MLISIFGHLKRIDPLFAPAGHVRPPASPLFTRSAAKKMFRPFHAAIVSLFGRSQLIERPIYMYVNKIRVSATTVPSSSVLSVRLIGSGARSVPAKFMAWTHFLGLDTLVWASRTRYVRHMIISD